MNDRACRYLKQRAELAATRITSITRILPRRVKKAADLDCVERLVVSHPVLSLGGAFVASALLARSWLSAASPRMNDDFAKQSVSPAETTEDQARTAPFEPHDTRESYAGQVAKGLLAPLVAFTSRAFLEGLLDNEVQSKREPSETGESPAESESKDVA